MKFETTQDEQTITDTATQLANIIEADLHGFGYVRLNVRHPDTGEWFAAVVTGIGSDFTDETPVIDAEVTHEPFATRTA